MTVSSFRFPTDVRFGLGSRAEIPSHLRARGLKRPLIVTDTGIAGLGFFSDLIADLDRAGFATAIYSDAAGNPLESHVIAGVTAYRQHGADCLILVGGGCALDVGKAISLMVEHPGTLFQYEDEMPEALPIDQGIPYTIAVPTTAGSGSEVGASSVISEDSSHKKKIIYSARLTPDLVIADPELTVGLPGPVTAATGVDALTHNIEAFLAKNYHPICDGIALEGIALIHKSLKTAVQEPKDLEARSDMLMASMMGAIAFQKGLGVIHSCAHALSTYCDMHHGLANAIMLLPGMRFNLDACPERFARIATAIGFSDTPGDGTTGVSKLFRWVNDLLSDIGIPDKLEGVGSGAGPTLEVPERLVELALEDVCHGNNPAVVNRDGFHKLFHQAINEGRSNCLP